MTLVRRHVKTFFSHRDKTAVPEPCKIYSREKVRRENQTIHPAEMGTRDSKSALQPRDVAVPSHKNIPNPLEQKRRMETLSRRPRVTHGRAIAAALSGTGNWRNLKRKGNGRIFPSLAVHSDFPQPSANPHLLSFTAKSAEGFGDVERSSEWGPPPAPDEFSSER